MLDHDTGEQLKLDDAEEALTDQLAQVINSANLLDLCVSKRNIDGALDQVAAAIKLRREGDSEAWDSFNRKSPEEWIQWYRALVSNDPEQHP